MSRRAYGKPLVNDDLGAESRVSLPTDRPVAVYYRQSDRSQVGNVSTAMQIDDLPNYLRRLGWASENIILIDDDAGISGATTITQRTGMAQVIDLIMHGRISAVACQDEDRLFRDATQIQVNLFVQACLEAGALVITPQMIYDFAGPNGFVHARQFRYKSELAADFLDSHVQGRLVAARQRLLSQGIWVGANIPVGFILDDRITLPDGDPNPLWHKFAPFEPYARVINAYYRLFLDHGGVVAATAADIRQHGPYYPDFDDPGVLSLVPMGYLLRKPARMKKHGDYYHPTEGTLGNLLTNAAYIGHWVVKNQVVKWNNHPAIVPEEIFMQAFNTLSERTLDGQPNPRFAPADRRRLFPAVRHRGLPRPLCAGLLVSDEEDNHRTVSVHWIHGCQSYGYALVRSHPGKGQVWRRKAIYVDRAISELLRAKLQCTFAIPEWPGAVTALMDDLESARSQTVRQLGNIESKMSHLLGNSARIRDPRLSEHAQRTCADYRVEHARLRAVIASVESYAQRKVVDTLRDQVVEAIQNWARLDADQLRALLQTFIQRVVVSRADTWALKLVVCWKDDSTDEICLPAQTTRGTYWLDSEVQLMAQLIDAHAWQIDMAAAFPDRTWDMIREKAHDLWGSSALRVGPKPIRGEETYLDYLERASGIRASHKATRGERWHAQEIDLLDRLVAVGKTQVEIAAAFPHRTWRAIRRRITLIGHDIRRVSNIGEIKYVETYAMYCARKAESGDGETAQGELCRQPRSSAETLGLASWSVDPFNLAALLLNQDPTIRESSIINL